MKSRTPHLICKIFVLMLFGVAGFFVHDAAAELDLPYSTRTQLYNGTSTTVHGDIRTVGMAGATVGLADTFIAASDNPAGLAMTLNNGDFNYTSNWVHDNRPQTFESSIQTSNFGAALNPYPWGISLGYLNPYRESESYRIPADPNLRAIDLNTGVREFRASAARVFLRNRLSLGVSLVLGQSETEYGIRGTELYTAQHSYALGATFGGIVQLENRILLGLSYSLPMRYAGDPEKTLPGITNYFQPVLVPPKLAAGVGWIPNRFFRAGFSLFFIGSTPDAALMRDQAIAVGQHWTVQPRLGAAYQFADYKEFSGTAFLGTYYEVTRISEAASRVHATGGIETKPWIFTIGWGIDASAGYKNYLVTAGLDLFKVMQKMDLIPKPWSPSPAGTFPNVDGISDVGLSRPLVKNWKPHGPEINPIRIGLGLPKKIQQKVIKAGKEIKKEIQTITDEFIKTEEE
ncbi:MAG: hypothetical protein A2603_15770 [Bdellovibrionales bacterium RIFOXYD1_FULL_55_31]|nr:MAG: hypothetical protein A2603_15770 [Bdellovibrionales bacterium RIFOXYD1_FULL_55_31]